MEAIIILVVLGPIIYFAAVAWGKKKGAALGSGLKAAEKEFVDAVAEDSRERAEAAFQKACKFIDELVKSLGDDASDPDVITGKAFFSEMQNDMKTQLGSNARTYESRF